MMRNEKQQGKRSILKALGFETLEEARSALETSDDDDIDDDPPPKKTKKKNEETKKEKEKSGVSVEQRYKYLLACIKAGVDPDDADDVVDMVLKRMDDEDDFSESLLSFKKKKPAYFGTSSGTGTGSNPKGKRGAGSKEGIGSRLGKLAKKDTGKNPYFS